MDRYQFITELQRHLTGKIPVEKLQEITVYYNDYIDGEVAKGKSEEEVLRILGEPRLLAKSIVETEGSGRNESKAAYQTEGYMGKEEKKWDSSGNLNRILFWFVIILVLCLVLSLIFGIIGIFIRYVLPVLMPVLIVCWIIKYLKK